MVKRYRSSIRQERGGKAIRIMGAIAVIIPLLSLLLPADFRFPALLFGLSTLISLVMTSLFRAFYVQLDAVQLEIRNAMLPFWRRRYRLSEIQGVEIGLKATMSEEIYLRVATNDHKSPQKIINRVGDADLPALIEELQRRGITVDTTQLQPYLNLLEQRKREKAQGEALKRKAREQEVACRRECEQREK